MRKMLLSRPFFSAESENQLLQRGRKTELNSKLQISNISHKVVGATPSEGYSSLCMARLMGLCDNSFSLNTFKWKLTRTSCRWQTRATRCITANVLQTSSAVAQCDKLATELSWQRFASKVANFQLPQLHLNYPTCIWRPRWGWPRLSFAEIFGVRKLESLGYRVALLAWSYV